MFDTNASSEFKNKLHSSGSVLLLLPPEPDLDTVSAAINFNDALSGTDKQVILGCSTDLINKYPDLAGVDQVKDHIGNQTLVVSFDYQEDAVENVSYDIDDVTKKFNLRIQPRPNRPPLDLNQITFSYTGAQAELVITFGINSLEELGRIYSEEKVFLDSASIANIISSPRPSVFATINLNSPLPLSESIAVLIKDLELKLTPTSATNLLQQLSKSTNNFSSSTVSADTFELAAFLLRSGAARQSSRPQFINSNIPPFPFGSPQPYAQAAPPAVEPEVLDLTKIIPNPQLPATNSQSGVPTDWTGPKIYRGGSPMK